MINKKCLMIFTLLILALMIIPMSFASDTSSVNQTNMDALAISDDNLMAIDDSSDVLTADENNIYVAKNGSDSGSGSQSDPYRSIEYALGKARGTTNIYINEGIYNEYSMSIKSSVNFIGLGNVIIDANNAGPIFQEIITSGIAVSLNNLTIKNANTSDQGSVINARGYNPLTVLNITFDGVKFINCYSKKAGAVLYEYGGSQAYPKNNVSISNCQFIECSSSMGSVIYLRANSNIKNSTFINNKYLGTSASGSAIFIGGYASANITGCTFIDNYADAVKHDSGAIYASSTNLGYLNINNNVFLNNSNYAITGWNKTAGAKINADNNWWGTNTPNFTALANNVDVKSYAILDISADPAIVDLNEKSNIMVTFYNNGTKTQNSLIPLRNITLTATGGNLGDKKGIISGEFETNFSSSAIGEYTITASVDNQDVSADVVVRDLSNKTATVAGYEINYKDVTISVNVAPSTATGNVTFNLNGKDEIIYLTNGKGNITLENVPIGEYDNIVLTYNGDANHKTSYDTISFMVYEKYPSNLTAEASVSGSDVTINVEMEPSAASGNVTFTVNGNDEIIYLADGKGNITVNLPNDDYEVELTYNGDDDYATSTDTVTFSVLNRIPTELTVTPEVVNDTVTFYAKLNEISATGNVTFYLKYRNQIIELENGEGNITIDRLTDVNYNVTFSYNGDKNYEPSNTTVAFKVPFNIKDTVLTAAATVKNQIVTIDADIDDYRAEGNVTFTINGEEKIINLTRSKGSITLENVSYGDYSILLTYNGDESHYPSNYTLNFSVIYYPYGEIIYVGPNGKDTANATADDPLLTVCKAIDIANNYENVKKIYIYNGVYTDSGMTIERSYDIEGESKDKTIIDAQGGALFEIYGLNNNNSFTNITFKNGYNDYGGAIRDYGNFLNVTDCIFENNTAGDMGGAIYHYYGDANIENTQFIENKAITGGAVYVSSYTNFTNINNAEFMGNEAFSGAYAGGAIYNAGTLLVNNSQFTANKAVSKSNSSYDISGGDGGAIYNANLLLVDYSQFNQNRAYYWGGAIKAGGESYISNSNFTANTAGSRGGAIHTSGSGSYSAWTTYISDCNFDENAIVDSAYEGSTKIGGAICAEAPTAIRDSNFTGNNAPNGGAIFLRSNAKYIDNCVFIDNSADNGGGAIFDNRTQSIISNSTFINNDATLGGAIHVSSSYASSEDGFTNLTTNNFYNNSAVNGGAIYSDAGVASPQELNIKYSEFIGNEASGSGSIIYTTNRANIENNALIFETNDNNVIWVNPQCEGLVSLEDNWWGVNNPNLERIIRGIVAPERFAVLNLTADPQKVEKNEASTITATLKWNDGTDNGVELIPFRDIELSATMGNLTNTGGVLDTNFESKYTSDIEGTYSVMAAVDNELQSVSVTVIGDAEVKSIIYVNSSNGDDKFGDGSIDNPVKTIARAYSLVEENGTIIMNGNFKGNGNTKLGISSYINNITFIGVNNTVIDGEHKNWIFSISDGIFTFINTTFKNAYNSGYGAAIINQAGYLFVENCSFIANVAQGSSAIDNTGYLVVIGSNFTDNIATVYDGGALSSSWEAYIINSTFTNNRAYQNGGAMKNYEEGYLYIERCEFTDNQAVGGSDGSYGGAVYSWASDVEIFLSNFTNNFANTKGGAVYASYGNSFYEWHAVVRQSIFEDNEATTGNSLFLELVVGDASYNVFLDDSNSVYTYSNYATIDNNWWGVNDPNWSSLLSGTIKKPDTYAIVNVSANPSEIAPDSTSKLAYEFFWNGTVNNENVSLIPKRSIELSSNGGNLANTSGNFSDAKFETSFTSNESGIYEIIADIDNEVLVINVTVRGGVIIVPSVKVDEDNVTISVELTPSVDGNITFELNGSVYTIPISNGKGNITLTGLDNGNYTVNLEFMGDETYPYSNKTVDFTVDKYIPQNSTVNVNVNVDDKNNVEISVDITPNDAGGNVTVTVGDREYVLPVINGKAKTTISDLTPGNYTAEAEYSGDDKYLPSASEPVSFTVNKLKDDVILAAPDVIKYYKGSERFYVYLTDSQSNKLSNQVVFITLNGVKYNRTTNENGSASMAVNLNSGVYEVSVEYLGNDNYSAMSIKSIIIVKSTVNGTDVVKVFRNGTQYYATFRDSQGNYLKEGTTVRFNINGVMYDRYVSGDKGLARLNINLIQGKYIITAMNPVTGENTANNITVIPRIIENNDITKYYKNGTQYTVKIIGDDGNPVGAGESVRFNINGVFYTRQTDANGIAKLNINLPAGDYIITSEYKECRVSNNIKVLPVLSASDITMSYRDGTQFTAKLVDGKGNPLANEKIEFNVNGVFYYRTTGNDGIARLNINLMPGEYIITSSYNGSNIANKITIH